MRISKVLQGILLPLYKFFFHNHQKSFVEEKSINRQNGAKQQIRISTKVRLFKMKIPRSR